MRTQRWRAAGVAAAVTTLMTLLTAAVLVGRADAATLFTDDFADGNAAGWTTSGGSWSVVSGAYQQSGTSADAKAQAGTTTWSDYTVQARVQVTAFGTATSRSTGIVARAQSSSNFYSLVLTPSAVQLRRGSTALASAAYAVATGSWHTLSLSASGSRLQQLLPRQRALRRRLDHGRRRAGGGQLLPGRAVPVLFH